LEESDPGTPIWQDAETDLADGTSNGTDEAAAAASHFAPATEGLGLDGSTPLEGGIQGRLTHAGGAAETPRNEHDWQVHVDVDQPVQRVDD
jgi:hypothetical protein